MSVRGVFSSCVCGCLAMGSLALRAQTSAPPSSSSSKSKPVKNAAPGADSTLDSGTVSAGVYRNPTFGFACKIPAGWVLRTEEMNAREGEGGDKTAADSSKSERVLLAAFSRPPEARAEDVNASILIAAESATAYPGLKEAAQYLGPVTEVAKAQGFEVVEEPYEFVMGIKTVVRGDFKKDVGTRVMRQSTLVVLARGYVMSFTFIGGSEDEVEELARGLSFGVAKGGK